MSRKSYTARGGPWDGEDFALSVADGEEVTMRDDAGSAHVYKAHSSFYDDEFQMWIHSSLEYVGKDPFA